MIQVTNAAYRALTGDPIELRLRVTWRLTRGAGGIDVTDRVVSISGVSRRMAPFVGEYGVSDCTVTLENTDGQFTTGADASFLRRGPAGYYLTEMKIEQGVVLPDGDVEYIDVALMRVQYVRFIRDVAEVKLVGNLAIISAQAFPEDYPFGSDATAAGDSTYVPAGDILDGMFDLTGIATTAIDTTTEGYEQVDTWLHGCAWPLVGLARRGSGVGSAVKELGRCCLSTIVDQEDGTVTFLPRVLPRDFGVPTTRNVVPDLVGDDLLAGDIEWNEGYTNSATEVIVKYSGTSISYRDTSEETDVGRITKTVSMEFLRTMSQAWWSARLIFERYKQFPLTASLEVPGYGLLVQLGDRLDLTKPDGTIGTFVVVQKVWTKLTVGLLVEENPTESSIYEMDTSYWATDSWGDAVL